MAESDILAVPQLEDAQVNKHLVVNAMLAALEKALGNKVKSQAGPYGSNLWTLTEAQFAREAYIFKAAGSAAANFSLVTPSTVNGNATERTFWAWNADTTYNCTVKAAGSGTTVILPPGWIAHCLQVGDNIVALSVYAPAAGFSVPYDAGFFLGGLVDDGVTVFAFKVPTGRAISLADDFAGSAASIGVNPTDGTATFDVELNGSPIGTIAITTGGSVTFATTGGAVALVPGDVLTVVSPSPADSTLADVAITFKGSAVVS